MLENKLELLAAILVIDGGHHPMSVPSLDQGKKKRIQYLIMKIKWELAKKSSAGTERKNKDGGLLARRLENQMWLLLLLTAGFFFLLFHSNPSINISLVFFYAWDSAMDNKKSRRRRPGGDQEGPRNLTGAFYCRCTKP